MLSDLEFAGYNRAQIEDINLWESRAEQLKAVDGQRLRRITITFEFAESRQNSCGKDATIELSDTESLRLDDVATATTLTVEAYKNSLHKEMDEYINDYIAGRDIQ